MVCKCSGKYIDIYFILKITYFLPALPVLLSPWFSLLLVFDSVSSSFFLLGLLRLAFRTLCSLLDWSVFASSSTVVLSLLLGSPFSLCFSFLSLSSGFSASFRHFFCRLFARLSFPTALLSYPFRLVCSCFGA